MGVVDFLTSDICAPHRITISLKDIAGKRIAADSNALLYLFKYGLFEHNNHDFLYRANRLIDIFLQFEISPLFIFEGKSPPWKEDERQKRSVDRKRKADEKEQVETKLIECQQARVDIESFVPEINRLIEIKKRPIEEKLVVHLNVADDGQVQVQISFVNVAAEEELKSDYDESLLSMSVTELEKLKNEIHQELSIVKHEEAEGEILLEKANLSSVSVTRQDIKEMKQLCELKRVPWLDAKYEADDEAEKLAYQKMIFGFVAKDGDTLWRGCNLLSYDSLRQIVDLCELNLYPINRILRSNHLKLSQLREICFMTGTDYSRQGLAGFGMKKSFEAIKEYGSLHSTVKNLIAKNEEKIDEIGKKKTSGTEKNIKIVTKATENIVVCKKFQEFYDQVSNQISTEVYGNLHEPNAIRWYDFSSPSTSRETIESFIASCKKI